MAQTKVTATEIDFSTFPFEITGMYPVFYTQPPGTGTVGTSYSTTANLPRTIVAGESAIIFPAGSRWGIPEFLSNTTTQFSFQVHCVVATSQMYSKWSAIYYKAN